MGNRVSCCAEEVDLPALSSQQVDGLATVPVVLLEHEAGVLVRSPISLYLGSTWIKRHKVVEHLPALGFNASSERQEANYRHFRRTTSPVHWSARLFCQQLSCLGFYAKS